MNGIKGSNGRGYTQREYRCHCGALCADVDTLHVHERFCNEPRIDSKHAAHFGRPSPKLKMPDSIRRAISRGTPSEAIFEIRV